MVEELEQSELLSTNELGPIKSDPFRLHMILSRNKSLTSCKENIIKEVLCHPFFA